MSQLLTFTFPLTATTNLFFRKNKANIDLLNVLLYNEMIKDSTADIVAGSGLNIASLLTIFLWDSEDF